MEYTERLQHVTVLGAAGKMGSGILLLTAIEMADLSLKPENKGKQFVMNAMDVSDMALSGLMSYLKVQVQKAAEKKVGLLRSVYENRADLVDNGEIIDQYVFDVLSIVRPTVCIEAAYQSTMIFEAIKEDPELKIKIFSHINQNNKKEPWFFTNTSSIPITKLDTEAKLNGRIIGFHFYNPPAVQKLAELIKAESTLKEVEEFALAYAKSLKKVVVPSHDFAGFIGNGHFMRDALHGISEVERLTKNFGYTEALYIINKVSQDFLIRPMGIFQLIDYVGIDVCQYIMKVMNADVKDEEIHSPLLDKFIGLNVKGGQNSDGSQKDGFLKYEKGRPVAIYDINKKSYAAIAEFQAKCDDALGKPPASLQPWKTVIGNPKKEEVFRKYFGDLKSLETLGAQLSKKYAARSKEIGQNLVKDKVAFTENDVNTVLLTGFFHAYGPINDYL
ncbi:MAG: 3-hydroxyacyl-CoA dehydrogenase family protein [Bacteroidia bacterium]|nr:3-hydroxyacyl-CoA dehydrogenase family protein [Bacteroidia bacterium]